MLIKVFIFFVYIFCVLLFPKKRLYACEVNIGTNDISSGYISISYVGSSEKLVKVSVKKANDEYIYDIKKGGTKLPLQMGTGHYSITILKQINGAKYEKISSKQFTVDEIDEQKMYCISMPLVNYEESTIAKSMFDKLSANKDMNEIISAYYDFIVENFDYDYDKALDILEKNDQEKKDYLPVLDKVFEAKKGICFDYSALFAAGLRSKKIPARLVMGYSEYAPIYHAWNEVFIDGKWVIIDTTSDSQFNKAKLKYEMVKDSSSFTMLKIY